MHRKYNSTARETSNMENQAIIALFDVELSPQQNVDKGFHYICDNYNIVDSTHHRLKEKLRKLFGNFKLKWEQAHRKASVFESSNSNWLHTEFNLGDFIVAETCSSPKPRLEKNDRSKRGTIDKESLDTTKDPVETTVTHSIQTPEEAFSFIIRTGLTQAQYENLHYDCPSRFPPYHVAMEGAKKMCAPPQDFVEGS